MITMTRETLVGVNDGQTDWGANAGELIDALRKFNWTHIGFGEWEEPQEPRDEDDTHYAELCCAMTELDLPEDDGDEAWDGILWFVFAPHLGRERWLGPKGLADLPSAS